jgi:hypothetical protein
MNKVYRKEDSFYVFSKPVISTQPEKVRVTSWGKKNPEKSITGYKNPSEVVFSDYKLLGEGNITEDLDWFE